MKIAVYYNKSALQDSMFVAFADQRSFRIDRVSTRPDLVPFVTREGMLRPSEQLVAALVKAGDIEPVDLDPSFIVGVLLKIEAIEMTKLYKCFVGVGSGKKHMAIVCGATNLSAGKKVVVATPGTVMPDGSVINKSVIAETESEGMLCSARELGMPPEGEKTIHFLPHDAVPGAPFFPQV